VDGEEIETPPRTVVPSRAMLAQRRSIAPSQRTVPDRSVSAVGHDTSHRVSIRHPDSRTSSRTPSLSAIGRDCSHTSCLDPIRPGDHVRCTVLRSSLSDYTLEHGIDIVDDMARMDVIGRQVVDLVGRRHGSSAERV